MKERLQKLLSAHGVASRRESERLIEAGRVTVNGVAAALGESADIEEDIIEVDGKRLQTVDARVYIMLNKPRGYVTTMKDEKGRRNVSDLVKDCHARVYPVGRLDLDSGGLLLMTNDGALTNFLTHPSNEKSKTYYVVVKGDVPSALILLSGPMVIDDYRIRPAQIETLKITPEGGLLSMTIHEGRNRQIRKMCALANLKVDMLTRVEEGGLKLGTLKIGAWRYLTDDEVNLLKKKNAGYDC